MEGKDEFQIRLNDLPEITKQELMERISPKGGDNKSNKSV